MTATDYAQQDVAVPGEVFEAIPDAVMFPIQRIVPQKDQPRTELELEHLNRIAADLKKKAGKRVAKTGLIHPLLVHWEPGAFLEDGSIKPGARVIITAGETRYEAAKIAGLTKLPVIITDQDSEEAYEDAVTENLLRGDLSPRNEGQVFLYFKNKYNLTSLQVAERLYHDPTKRGYVDNRLDMMRLNDIVRQLVDNRKKTLMAARRIQTIKNEDKQRELVKFMLEEGGTFEELNKKIKAYKGQVDTGQTQAQKKEEREARKKLAAAFPAAGVVGTPKQDGVKTASRINIGDALDSMITYAELMVDAVRPVEVPPSSRKNYRAKVRRLRKILDGFEEEIGVEAKLLARDKR